jgi:hypothetical protein
MWKCYQFEKAVSSDEMVIDISPSKVLGIKYTVRNRKMRFLVASQNPYCRVSVAPGLAYVRD